MPQFNITIIVPNSKGDECGPEVAWVLKQLAKDLKAEGNCASLHDPMRLFNSNGEPCGSMEIFES